MNSYTYPAHNRDLAAAMGNNHWTTEVRISGAFPSRAAFLRALQAAGIVAPGERALAAATRWMASMGYEPAANPDHQPGQLYVRGGVDNHAPERPLSELRAEQGLQ